MAGKIGWNMVLMVTAVLATVAPVAARPGLDDRINQHNIWRQLAKTGDIYYLMVTQPSDTDKARARELGLPMGGPSTFYDETALAVGQPIQFTRPADTGGIDEFGPGILNRRVENNALTFDVGPHNAYLAWGNYDGKHAQYGYKPFGVARAWARNGGWYSDVGMYTGRPVPIFLRVRQSQPKSTWKIVTGPNPEYNQVHAGVAPGGDLASFYVTGTGWQTISVVYGDKIVNAKRRAAEFRPFGSFVIYPGDPGNHVELAWVIVGNMQGYNTYARRTVTLPANAREARMTLSTWDSQVYVNGTLAADRGYTIPGAQVTYRIVDLKPFLTAGRNVIAVHQHNNYGEFQATGHITCADGTWVPLFSWLPMKEQKGKGWVPDPTVRHFSLESPHAGPWKTSFLFGRPEDEQVFMKPEYDDSDWGTLGAGRTSGHGGYATPYFGLISVELPKPEKIVYQGAVPGAPRLQPVFSTREPVVLMVQGLRVTKLPTTYTMTYTLRDELSDRIVDRGSLTLDKQNAGRFEKANLAPGPYELLLTLQENGRTRDQRSCEFAVVGRIEQPVVEGIDILEGMTLAKVADIDCSAPIKEGEFGAFGPSGGKLGAPYETKVVAAPFGSFRETGPMRGDCFSYKVTIPHPTRPHIMEVVYPDDRLRVHGFFYNDRGRPSPDGRSNGTVRCSIGVLSGWPNPPSNTMKRVYGLFWPVSDVGTATVFTTRYGPDAPAVPAAASRIVIHEVQGEIPQLKINRYPGQFKPQGQRTGMETIVVPNFHAGPNQTWEAGWDNANTDRPELLADWYTTSTNFVRQMRFHGDNVFLTGEHKYSFVYFPSVFNAESGRARRDWKGLMAGVFAENDCSFLSHLEVISISEIQAEGFPSRQQLARGRPTLGVVSKTGAPRLNDYVNGVLPNWAHPKVQAMLLTEIDELINLYKEYPAWKGIDCSLNTLVGPSYGEVGGDPLALSYDDATFGRFAKETGTQVPVDAVDPQRFGKRYAWVMAAPGMKDKFVQWRCDALLALNRQIRDRIKAARPDCNLYLDLCYPYGNQKVAKSQDPEELRKYIMLWGWDVKAYQQEPGIVIYTMTIPSVERMATVRGKPEQGPLQRGASLAPGYLNLLANNGRGGVDLYTLFTEDWPFAEPGKWLWSVSYGNPYHWPTGDDFNDYWTNSLIRSNPTLTMYNGCDSNLDSRLEQGIRRYAQAWQSLPNGRYQVLKGDGLDRNISLQQCVEKPEYLYVANPSAWAQTTTLTFPAGAMVTDLNRGRPITLGDRQAWRLSLAPYAVQSFVVQGVKGAAVLSAETTVDAAAVARLRAQVQREQDLADRLQQEHNSEATAFAAQVTKLKAALDGGDYATVEASLRGGYEYHQARKAAVERKPKHRAN